MKPAHGNPLRCADCETIRATVVALIIFIADERNNAFDSWHRAAKPQLVDFIAVIREATLYSQIN